MKYFILFLCYMVLGLSAKAEPIVLKLDCREATGPVVGMLFDSAEGFRGLRDPVDEFVIDCEKGVELDAERFAEFALVVYFDQNGNGQLDRNFMGIPSEPIGFSGNYSPKGPPQYAKASIRAGDWAGKAMALDLNAGLGPKGRWGVGGLLLYRSSVYRGEDSGEFRAFPAISYVGKRLQVLGPNITVGLSNSDRLRTALSGSFRGGSYEEKDSPIFMGLGDREDTFLLGASLNLNLSKRVDFSLSLKGDVLDRIGGAEGRARLSYGFNAGSVNVTPYIGLSYSSSTLSRHDYGVEEARARDDLPSYSPGALLSPELGLSLMKTWGENYMGLITLGLQRLDDDAYNSPLVDERMQASGFISLSYQF